MFLKNTFLLHKFVFEKVHFLYLKHVFFAALVLRCKIDCRLDLFRFQIRKLDFKLVCKLLCILISLGKQVSSVKKLVFS